jgi:UDP-N-acetylmuramoyl-tripeptide--D-alanyl-D-alanine ligase
VALGDESRNAGFARSAARRVRRIGREAFDTVCGLYRRTLEGRSFIAVTGSAGKTTTTALIGHLLQTRGVCHGGRPGENQARLLRWTLLRMPRAAQAAVVEASGFPPGNIARVNRIVGPTMAVITRVGSDHYSEFRGREGVAAEKGQLVRALPASGVAVLNADDPHVIGLRGVTSARVVTFGVSRAADVRAEDVSATWPDRLSFTLVHGGERRAVRTRFAGRPWVTSALAAVSAARTAGLTIDECARALETFDPIFGRWSTHEPAPGVHAVLDTCKGAQWTVAPLLEFVGEARARRKVFVMGGMSDYAGASSSRYRAIAREIIGQVDEAWFVGNSAHYVERLVTGDGRVHVVPDVRGLCDRFWATIQAGDLVVVKGVQSDHLERLLLAKDGGVACWKTGCRIRFSSCLDCQARLAPHLAPTGLG